MQVPEPQRRGQATNRGERWQLRGLTGTPGTVLLSWGLVPLPGGLCQALPRRAPGSPARAAACHRFQAFLGREEARVGPPKSTQPSLQVGAGLTPAGLDSGLSWVTWSFSPRLRVGGAGFSLIFGTTGLRAPSPALKPQTSPGELTL